MDAWLRKQNWALHRLELAEARLEDVERGDGRDTVHQGHRRSKHEDYWGDDDDGGGGGGDDPADQRSYTVADDGTVSYTDGEGRSYTVSDDDLADDVRNACPPPATPATSPALAPR